MHLRYVDLSHNELDDVSALGWLDHLLTVRVDFNLLAGSIVLLDRRYLQVASFADNQLTSCHGAAHPMLDHLCLNSTTTTALCVILTLLLMGALNLLTSLLVPGGYTGWSKKTRPLYIFPNI